MSVLYAVMCRRCKEFAALRYPPSHPHWYCPRCAKELAAEWRPVVGNQVKLLEDCDDFDHRYILLAIDGDEITLRRAGFPRDHDLGRPFTRFVWDLDPVRSPRPVIGLPAPGTGPLPALQAAAERTPAEPPDDLVRRAAAKLREPDAEFPVGTLAELADWLEECAPQVRGCLVPTSTTAVHAIRTALVILGGAR